MYQPIDWTPLLAPTPPWAHLVCCTEGELNGAVGSYLLDTPHGQQALVRFIRAERCETWKENYAYWEAALQFPYHPGYNTRIFFDECIQDLSWLRACRYVFIVTNANLLLRAMDEAYFVSFVESLGDAAKEWAKSDPADWAKPEDYPWWEHPSTSFHVLFHCERGIEQQTRERYARVKVELDPVPYLPANEASSVSEKADDLIAAYIEPYSAKSGISNVRAPSRDNRRPDHPQ